MIEESDVKKFQHRIHIEAIRLGNRVWSLNIVCYLHIRKVLEDEGLVELWVEILPVDFCLVLWLLVRE